MKCRRGRVSISMPEVTDPYMIPGRAAFMLGTPTPRIHIGHARTMILGEILCRELEIPYHLRLEGERANPQKHFSFGTVDLLHCVSWLGIKPDYTYWRFARALSDDHYQRVLGANAWSKLTAERVRLAAFGLDNWITVCEDLEWYPSLMIRGAEFVDPESYAADLLVPIHDPPAMMRKIIEYEKAIYAAAGLELHQATLPLVLASSSKMSKSLGCLGWDCLKSVSADDARRYLIATAANPLDPLAAIGHPVDVRDLDPTPHVWSWETWGEFIRKA